MMKRKTVTMLLAAAFSAVLCPLQSFAQQSPEFAYTAAKWASLRDNRLEYEEIADLVHEYNHTVLENAIRYRDEYDKDSDDVAQDYYEAADTILSNMSYPDSDDENFASGVASYLNSEIQVKNLLEQGDESTDNAETIKLGYDKTEADLVKQAQKKMISYWSQTYELETLRDRKTEAESELASEQTRLAAGMSTQAKLLSAQQAVSSADASIQSAESSLAKSRDELCLMLGWSYGSGAEIGELPEPDIEAIRGISLEEDIVKAKENNYTLKSTRLQLGNARTVSVRDTLIQKQTNGEQSVSNSVSSAYKALMIALSDYEQAKQAFETAQAELNTAERKFQAGIIPLSSCSSARTSCNAAEVKVRTGRLALLTAYVDYQWSVEGLADA